jgi:hypothetical protein
MDALTTEWVAPFYLRILHGNYATSVLSDQERARFNHSVHQALDRITPEIASDLIAGHWREAITGSWLAGLKRITPCRELIGRRLLASEACYAGQSHAFAMACFADAESATFLERYLDEYLQRIDCCYDQGWAMPALMWIDEVNGSERSRRFLVKDGPWDSFTSDKVQVSDAWTLAVCQNRFWRSMNYCREHFIKA